MSKLPPVLAAILLSLFSFQSSAQKTVINEDNNGKVNFTYAKQVVNTQTVYTIEIIYKNEQTIYKEQSDTLVLNTATAVQEFIAGLESGIAALSDQNKNFKLDKPNYTLFKYNNGVVGTFISISNHSGSIVSNNNKVQATILLDWLKSINFGKE